jgi:hypothetical protein
MNNKENEKNARRKDAELSPFQESLIEYDEMLMDTWFKVLPKLVTGLRNTGSWGNGSTSRYHAYVSLQLMLDKEAKR